MSLKQVPLQTPKYKKRKRYTQDSDRLWEDAPVCQGYKIKYKSKWKNKEGDPVFYKKGKEPALISPYIKPVGPGCFKSYPGGLDLDPDTGEIDINNSSTGIRYKVEFTPCGKDCAAQATVVMGGVFYQGHLSSLSSTEPLVSVPYYFGHDPEQEVPTTNVPASNYGYIPEGVKPTANLRGLSVDPDSGQVDLRATIKSGALGFREGGEWPVNGTSKEFKMYYQLNTEQGRDVINHTTLRIHFFDTEADVPEELLARIRQQRNSIYTKERIGKEIFTKAIPLTLLLGMPFTWVSDSPWDALTALLAACSSFLFLTNVSDNPLRPPEEIIIGQ